MFVSRALLITVGVSLVAVALAVISSGGQDSLAVAVGEPIYVDADAASGANDGTSWGNAYTTLQPALAAAASGAQVWVAAGVFKPGIAGHLSATIRMTNGVALYGGFAGGENSLDERDFAANPTVLSGDIDGDDITDSYGVVTDVVNINGDNAYHVVNGSGVDSTAILDGFIITAGHADGSSPDDRGGGMYNAHGHPMLTNVTLEGNHANRGGGMYNRDFAYPTLISVTFTGNHANRGGGMYNYYYSSPTLTNVTFYRNHADSGSGGGMYNYGGCEPTLTSVTFADNHGGGMQNIGASSPALTNVVLIDNHGIGMYNDSGSSPMLTAVAFIGNDGGGMVNKFTSNPELTNVTFAGNHGSGMHNYYSDPTLVNAIFSGNRAHSGGGMYNDNSHPMLTNVTFSGNHAEGNGGAMYNRYSGATLVNCILWGNSGAQISGFNGGASVEYGLIEGGCPTIATCDSNLLTSDPQFVTPITTTAAPTTSGNYRLQVGSPAIDAGTAVGAPATDLDGMPRDAAPDIGAYEWRGFRIYLLLVTRD